MREKQPDEIFCSECGEIIKRSAKFCSHCGAKRVEQPAASFQKHITPQESAESNPWEKQLACPRCGRIINASNSQCPHCNTHIANKEALRPHLPSKNVAQKESQQTCKNCGYILSRSEAKCNRCGTLSVTKDSATSEKQRIPALLLVLFLGGVGAHRFYVGKIKSAITILIGNIIFWLLYIKYFTYFSSFIIGFGWEYFFLVFKSTFRYLHYEKIIFLLLGVGISVILLIDLIKIITGSFTDSEGKLLSK